ncbi:MAG: hypothetical protein M3340_13865 [Actinomycetota bacterium]|nr:hypothetical protein [Actinomycetota bacterium]
MSDWPTEPGGRAHPTVSIVTAHGRQPLRSIGNERLIDLLNRHNVAWSAVAIYVVPRAGGEAKLADCLDAQLDEMSDAAEILLYYNRNINPFSFSLEDFKVVPSADPGAPGTEYFYQRLDNDRSASEAMLKKLTPEECRSVIADRVADTIREHMPDGGDLVAGVSGGGDSNALLYGLTKLRDEGLNVHPTIIKGIPDWDAGVPRAQELCESYDLDLVVLEEPDVKALLGMPDDGVPLIDRFEREFKGDDFEFLGTLLIRLALAKRARDLGTPYMCTGLNLEDVLCESMFRISSGMKPAPFPAREIGDVTLVFPLWLCPKRIIDGCFPKFSLDNYEARYPGFSLGRNLYYSVVYAIQSQFPGYVEQLAQGLSQLSMEDPVTYTYHEQLGFHTERFVPFPLLRKFQRMLGGTPAAT